MDWDLITEELNSKLDISSVKKRKTGRNVKDQRTGKWEEEFVDYIEGWFAIDEANRIFGFDSWNRETIYCREVNRVETQGDSGKYIKVGYEAKVRITVKARDGELIVRDGTGHGSGKRTDLFDAIEGAAKEAETDAMKRALSTFGNRFGLALYDKERKNVGDQEAESNLLNRRYGKYKEGVKACKSEDDLTKLYNKAKGLLKDLHDFNKDLYEEAMVIYNDKFTELKNTDGKSEKEVA